MLSIINAIFHIITNTNLIWGFTYDVTRKADKTSYVEDFWTSVQLQSCTQIIRPLARFYSYDYDLRKTNYIFKWLYFKEIER